MIISRLACEPTITTTIQTTFEKPMSDPTQPTKVCTTCRISHPTTNFFRNRSKKDGLSSLCKSCSTKLIRQWRTTPEGMESVCRHNRKPRDKSIQERWRKTPAGRAYRITVQQKYRARNKDKSNARDAVNAEVKHNRLPRAKTLPCVRCGKPAREYHHHQGYTPQHRLHVVAVCRSCHLILDH